MKRGKNDHRKLSIHPLIYTGKVFFITWWDSTRAGHCTSAWLPTLKKLQYLFTHEAFTASNRVQAPLRTSHNNLYVFSVICHALVNLIWHPKSAKRSQLLTNLSQAAPMESECKLLLKPHVGTRKAKDESPTVIQQQHKPCVLTGHTLLPLQKRTLQQKPLEVTCEEVLHDQTRCLERLDFKNMQPCPPISSSFSFWEDWSHLSLMGQDWLVATDFTLGFMSKT